MYNNFRKLNQLNDNAGKEKQKKKKNKQKTGKKNKKQMDNTIYLLPNETKLGIELPEVGRLPNMSIPDDVLIIDALKKRNEEVRLTLRSMEEGDKDLCQLWERTKQWSLAEFKTIYKWLNCRFDHDFFESDCGKESLKMVEKYYQQGLLINSNGAIGINLDEHDKNGKKIKGLGFCLLRKSNGSGLYATKDLFLAHMKFDKYNIDESIYVVDISQTLHFQQVFKTLELMGYPQAKKCYHLAYGLVVLPHGKMSSRKGTVIFFSKLKKLLRNQILKEFLAKYENVWDVEEIEAAERALSVACIKFGMLNHAVAKDIVFNIKDWTAKEGNPGVYLMYTYTRIASIRKEVTHQSGVQPDWKLLNDPIERQVLTMLNDVWLVIQIVLERKSPSPMCDYLYALGKAFMSWYESHQIKNAESEQIKVTRLAFATQLVLRSSLD